MRVVSGRRCNDVGQSSVTFPNRICQMNFGVTKQYAVSRSTQGTFSSTKDLPDYRRQGNTPVLQTNEMIKTLEPFMLQAADKSRITTMVNKYVNLAVKMDVIDDKLDNQTAKVVSKIPGKNIFVIDAKTPNGQKGSITVSEKATYQ